MLDTLIFSLNAILPLAILMGLGMFLRWRKVCKAEFFNAANSFSFKVLLPAMLFKNIYDATTAEQAFDWKFVGLSMGVTLALTGALLIVMPRIMKDPKRTGVAVQAIYRSNSLIFGIPMITSMFGEGELWAISMTLPFVIPFYNISAVMILEYYGNRGEKRTNWKVLAKKVITTPLVVASIAAYLFVATGLPMPEIVYDALGDVAGLASPLALIALGGVLSFSSFGRNLRDLVIICGTRLLLIPVIFVAAGALTGYTGPFMGTLLTLGGAPTAVSSYVMAEQSGCDGELAAQVVAMTTVLSVFTMFLWIFITRSMGIL